MAQGRLQSVSEGSAQGGEEMSSILKKIGTYTCRGVMPDRTQTRIQLWDGSFKTAYRVTKFIIANTIPHGTADQVAVLKTDGQDGGSIALPFWDFSHNKQIGWAAQENHTTASVRGTWSLVDPDHLIVEDLFVTGICSADGQEINYYLEMEKYAVSDWQGALALVRARSQGD